GAGELDYLYQRLGAVVAAESGPPAPARACGRFIVGRWEGRDLMAVDGGYLARLVSSRGRERDAASEWLASRPLVDLTGGYPEGAVFSLSERPYLAVLRSERRGGSLETDVRIYDLIEGAYACGTRFAAPPSPPSAFLKAFSQSVDQITPQLHVEYNDSEGRMD